MTRYKKTAFVIAFLFALTGCSSDIEIHNSKSEQLEASAIQSTLEKDSSMSMNKTENPKKNLLPQIGERFYAYPLITSGTLYATVTNAEYYTNIYDANIDPDCFCESIQEFQQDESIRYYDNKTGEILNEEAVNAPRVFVKVQITVENVDAISFWQQTEKGLRCLDPMFRNGYCEQYDFSANDFGIGIQKESNAYDTQNTTGTGVEYFSLEGQLYSDEYRSFMYRLEPGETISFEIGKFMPAVASHEELTETFGGKLGDELISRYCIVTSSSPFDPIVNLQLQ